MLYGISAGALVVQDQRVLLVHHFRAGDFDFWVPPGGGLEGEESIFDCAKRETFEETGLSVEPERIVYIQEFVEPAFHFCKFFILCRSLSGNLTLAHRNPQEHDVIDGRFFARDEVNALIVYPAILHDLFWEDLEAGFPEVRYLGLQKIP